MTTWHKQIEEHDDDRNIYHQRVLYNFLASAATAKILLHVRLYFHFLLEQLHGFVWRSWWATETPLATSCHFCSATWLWWMVRRSWPLRLPYPNLRTLPVSKFRSMPRRNRWPSRGWVAKRVQGFEEVYYENRKQSNKIYNTIKKVCKRQSYLCIRIQFYPLLDQLQ